MASRNSGRSSSRLGHFVRAFHKNTQARIEGYYDLAGAGSRSDWPDKIQARISYCNQDALDAEPGAGGFKVLSTTRLEQPGQ